MFGELLESRARRPRHRAGTAISVVAHGALVILGISASGSGGSPLVQADDRVVPLRIPSPPEASGAPSRPSYPGGATKWLSPAPPILLDLPDLAVQPFAVPDLLPPPGAASAWVTDSAPSRGATGGSGAGTGESVPFAWGVEKPAIALPGNPSPRYPDVLRNAGITGIVTVQVVVDTLGRADLLTLKVIRSAHEMLSASVAGVLPMYRFIPAETGGRKVRMWVEMSFRFELRKNDEDARSTG